MRETDTLDTEGIFRLIESVPSPKAEPFKVWLAKLGRQKVDEVFDPPKGIDQILINYENRLLVLENTLDKFKEKKKKIVFFCKTCDILNS